jgi:hypothetical protein
MVRPVPRYQEDLEALATLMLTDNPPLRYDRRKEISTVVYGFVDASGLGFGSSLTSPGGILYTIGVWGKDDSTETSNFRELHNLVATLERHVDDGSLSGSEVYLFTDNTTAEASYFKGNTPSLRLFELVLRLRRLEMSGALLLNVVHVAGMCMRSQGTDGLSRGDVGEGVMSGQAMLAYIPLHLSAIDRQPSIKAWVRSWTGQPSLTPLAPEDWYGRGHGVVGGQYNQRGLWLPSESNERWFLWTPPPSAASAALEELLISRHKRTHLNHVVIIPRLATATWRKKLYKVFDVVFEVPPGRRAFWPADEHEPMIVGLTLRFVSSPPGRRAFWPADEHEPLIVGLTLRFVSSPPWQLRQSPLVLDLARNLHGVWEAEEGAERPFLCQLSHLPEWLEAM